MYQWYLIHPYGCIDKFVPLFKEDLKAFGFDINLDFKDKNELEKLVHGLKQAGITITVEDYKFNLDKYYRRCRNLLAHKLDDKVVCKILRYTQCLYSSILLRKKNFRINQFPWKLDILITLFFGGQRMLIRFESLLSDKI